MDGLALVLRDYWPILIFIFGGIMTGIIVVWNAIKKRLPIIESRVTKVEGNILDEEGNRDIVKEEECIKLRKVCHVLVCGKIDKLEKIVKDSSESTAESMRDLHEKREVTTRELKKDIAGIVDSVNVQINQLNLSVGRVQGQLEKMS